MQKGEKYIYNQQTLQFEKVKISNKNLFFKVFMYISSVAVTALIFYFLTSEYFPSPKEKLLQKEMAQLEYNYQLMESHLERANKIVQNLQTRDAKVHRVLLGMDPIDQSIWNGGVGGHKQNQEFDHFNQSTSTVKEANQFLKKLERQIYLQSKSLDTLEKLAKSREEMIQSIPSVKPVRIDHLDRQVQNLSGYGIRLHPVHKINKLHEGIDFTAPEGTPVQATGNGKIIKVEAKGSGYGKSILIDHGFGYQTLYAHMKEIKVRQGEKVKKGQNIGTVGSSGLSTGPHCHYEVRYNGRAINPIHYCMDGLSPKEYQEMAAQAAIANQSFD